MISSNISINKPLSLATQQKRQMKLVSIQTLDFRRKTRNFSNFTLRKGYGLGLNFKCRNCRKKSGD